MVEVLKHELIKSPDSGQVYAEFPCPKCGNLILVPLNSTTGYNVMYDGRVDQEILCGHRGCTFLDKVRLVGFNPAFFRGEPLTGEGTPI